MSIRNKYGEDIKMETIMERYRQLEKEFWELEWMEPIEKTLKLDTLYIKYRRNLRKKSRYM